MKEQIQQIFDEVINPAVAGHGGSIELIDVRDNKVFVRMMGGCQGCGAANMTLRMGIEQMLKHHFPEIEALVDETDHAAGENPYIESSE